MLVLVEATRYRRATELLRPMDVPIEDFLPNILALPPGRPLAREELLIDAFRLHRDHGIEIFFMPTDGLNPAAQLLLVGITPGWTQMELAYRHVRLGLLEGLEPSEARAEARYAASFGGSMRVNLIAMLDGISINALLKVSSTQSLFDDERRHLHSTSVLRHPVFVDGENSTGHGKLVDKNAFAMRMQRDIFIPELKAVPNALVVPMGDYVSRVVKKLANDGVIDERRCLFGFPHPSGANGHRRRQYGEHREALTRKATAWFEASGRS